jgi:phage terminase large subunit-like protein
MFSEERANHVINFIQMLKLTDDFYGKPFIIMDWLKEILKDVYGTVKESGYRQYKYAYLEIPKKNAKTTSIAGLAVYHLTCDPEEGQIYCCAADRGQATLVYKAALSMIEQNPTLTKLFKITDSRKEIKNMRTGTILKVLSAESYSKHGINPTVVIFDELHAQRNRDLWDVMTFGAGATRKEPLWWVITTAGDDPDRNSIGWEVHEYAKRIQDGEIEDPSWYAKVYCADETDDIWDEATWYKANPGLGITINIDAVREEATTARNNPANEKLFRWLRLNQWVSLKTVGWLDLSLWDNTQGEWDKSELLGKKCYIGLDLASTSDLTGMSLLFPPQDGVKEWRFISEGWIPEENMKQRIITDHAPYDKFLREGWLHTTPGNVADYDYIKERIEYFNSIYKVKMLCVDPWNSRMLTQQLEKSGLNIVEVSQNIAMMSPGMKEIERLMKAGQMEHEENNLARWCFGNVNIHVDGNENVKPMKNKSRERIDITVSLINAMAIAIKFEQKASIYEDRGLRIL